MGLGVAVECHAHDGFHYNEADLMLEVIDPETGEVLGEDEEGELVFTSLNRVAMPLVRYRTYDLSKLIGGTCRCGATTLKKIAPIMRRRESTVNIGSAELYPAVFDELLFSLPDVIDYQVILGTEGNRDILRFKVEVIAKSEGIQKLITSKRVSCPLIRPNREPGRLDLDPVEIVGRGELKRLNRAKNMIMDGRKAK
jgi:phenylacetate-CoA ligase